MANLNQITKAGTLALLNKEMGASNSAAMLTKYLELNNLYPSEPSRMPEAQDVLRERKASPLIN